MNDAIRRSGLIPAAFGLAGLVACGPGPADIDELREGQQKILARIESVQRLLAAPSAAARRPPTDPDRIYALPVGASPVRGPGDAKVTIVGFSDFQCPYCAQVVPMIDQVLAKYPADVNFVFKHFPLVVTHPNALSAAKAAAAAGQQGKFWEMHDILFQNHGNLARDRLKEFAARIPGLDVARWERDFESPAPGRLVTQDFDLGDASDVRSTPTFFVNGKRVMNRTVGEFSALIDQALQGKS